MPADVSVPTRPVLTAVPDVELIRTGTWNLSTGVATFTTADLQAAVSALGCPAMRNPVLKLGHNDPRFDGEPAIGWVANLACSADGTTLTGDYLGVPQWLADVMASAYPDRSIEGCYNFTCQLGHVHPFVVTAVALLGVEPPGVGALKSLQDVASLYQVSAGAGQPVVVRASERSDMPKVRTVAATVTAEDVRRAFYDSPLCENMSTWLTEIQLDPPQVIFVENDEGELYRAPYAIDNGKQGPDAVTFGPPVEVLIQYVDAPPDQEDVLEAKAPVHYWTVEASREGLAAAAIAVHHTGTTGVTWDGPLQKTRLHNSDGGSEYRKAFAWVDPNASADTKTAYRFIHHQVGTDGGVGDANVTACRVGIGVLNGGRGGTTIPDGDRAGVYRHLAAHLKDAGIEPPELATNATGKTDRKQEGVSGMAKPDPEKLRAAFGLEPDATEEELQAAIREQFGGQQSEEQNQDDSRDESPERSKVAAARRQPDGTMVIDASAWQEREDRIERLERAAARAKVKERDEVIDAAVRAGKFPVARKDHWRKLWDVDPDGIRDTIEHLTPNVIPTVLAGYSGGEDLSDDDEIDREFASIYPPGYDGSGRAR